MDWQNLIRILFTVVCFAFFVGVCFWAYSRHNKADMDEAAQLPFLGDDDEPESHPGDKQS
ncbi:MAG TPA: CcoQ/FixQ family Cbb3-type cytochrome c oxidase assembly chaperone [Chitinolyticbacter sp.]|uniref:cbb3-type cytochrome oxidase subunit 3 n=1 Tax=Chitinolyticbacter albus TaxID=2961951 RepID=UPI00210D5400|nr:CcoQ/FixQ family Cbb3-type cytochrome c oxidase assembly chaperone [Chitinolyticbacter albus]HSC79791.1 CcoQ/FixQ family Cbb3-type cytochrome c oxidase assembly chaperone [Chitinolyticbacter sp.]